MADYLDVGKIVSEGYGAGKGVAEDIASKDILQQMYAGQTPEDIKDPVKQAATLQSAAGMLQSKGLNSAAYKLQKQAGDLSTSVNKQELDTLKVKQGELEYAGQLLQSAGSDADLQNVINETVKDPAARMSVEAVMRNPNLDFAAKKKALVDMTQTADQHLRAQALAVSADDRIDRMDTRDLRLELSRIESKAKNGLPLSAEEKLTRETGVLPKYQKKGVTVPTPSGEEPAGDFLSSRAAVESGGYKGDAAYSAESKTSSAVGKYGITKGTYDKIREEDPSLPEFSKLKNNKDAQDKAAKIHEKQITKEITAAGLDPTNANKDLWWRFGDADAKKLVKADSNTPVKDVLNEKVIAANPDLQGKVTVGDAIAKNLSGGGKTSDISYETAKANKKADVVQMYEDVSIPIQKQIGDIAQVGKEFAIPPNKLVGQGAKAKVAIVGDYDVLQQTEKVSSLIAKNPSAVGTLASLVQSSGGLTRNLLDNVASNKDNKYTEEVAILAKELTTLGLQDAAASGGGRINQYLEKMFVGIYDKSLSPQSLVGVLKDRQDDAVRNLNRRIGADKENLDKEEYPLLFSKSSKSYMDIETAKTKEEDKKYGVDSTKERPPIGSFGGGQGRKFQFGQGDLSF